MAGLISALFGGKARPPDPDPLPGQGGYSMPPGPDGTDGFPGSTSATRTFGRNINPRQARLRTDQLGGFDQALSATQQVRQASYRGDVPGATAANPRDTSHVGTPQPILSERMQANSPAEFYGGPKLRTDPGLNDTAGGESTRRAAEAAGTPGIDPRDTTTLYKDAQPQIGVGTPGAENVRNSRAQRHKAKPGQTRTYQSAPRGDLPGANTSTAASAPVTVPSRFVFKDGGNQTWSVLREMPYGGRGNGARGADLNGQRYYAAGGYDNFQNGGQGAYGISRQRGRKRPIASFVEPAPWSSNFYDTTEGVGSQDNPGTMDQSPDLIYVSPQAPRATNGVGRRG